VKRFVSYAITQSTGGFLVQLSAKDYDQLPEHLKRLFYKAHNPGSAEVMDAFAAFGERKAAPHGPGVVTPGMFGIKAGHPGFSDSGTAARFFYCAKASKADRAGSKHPTVKPIALIRYLVKLVCPPGGTVLDPFGGSGTTGAAALAEGRKVILIEREAEYVADIRRRLRPTVGGRSISTSFGAATGAAVHLQRRELKFQVNFGDSNGNGSSAA
jgi:hypothetical protein